VPHVHDRAPGRAPRAQELCDALFEVRVVSPAPPRLVEAVLEIDEEEGRPMGFEGEHRDPAVTVPARGHRTKTPMLSIGEADDKVAR
jgi:hypothetical protein